MPRVNQSLGESQPSADRQSRVAWLNSNVAVDERGKCREMAESDLLGLHSNYCHRINKLSPHASSVTEKTHGRMPFGFSDLAGPGEIMSEAGYSSKTPGPDCMEAFSRLVGPE